MLGFGIIIYLIHFSFPDNSDYLPTPSFLVVVKHLERSLLTLNSCCDLCFSQIMSPRPSVSTCNTCLLCCRTASGVTSTLRALSRHWAWTQGSSRCVEGIPGISRSWESPLGGQAAPSWVWLLAANMKGEVGLQAPPRVQGENRRGPRHQEWRGIRKSPGRDRMGPGR